MYNSEVLLLVFALSSVPVEAFDASLLAGKLSNCIFETCAIDIYICHRVYGELLVENFKACMKQRCTEQMRECLDLIMAERLAVTGVDMITDSFIHCYLHSGLQNKTKFTGCFLEALVDQTQPYISMLAAGSSDPESMSCWLRRGLGVLKSCFHHYSERYTLILHVVREFVNNRPEYVKCFMKVFNDGNKQCIQMFMQLFGTTPAMRMQAKGFFICSIHETILLTATC